MFSSHVFLARVCSDNRGSPIARRQHEAIYHLCETSYLVWLLLAGLNSHRVLQLQSLRIVDNVQTRVEFKIKTHKRLKSFFKLQIVLWYTEENSMVVVPFASLLSKSGILFLSHSVTALPSLPSKLALKPCFV